MVLLNYIFIFFKNLKYHKLQNNLNKSDRDVNI